MKESLILKTNGLTKNYGSQTAVNNVNLHVKKGRIYGLLGRNGAGKTTLMKMVLGLISITEGEITVFGESLKGNENNIYPRIGSIIETPGFYSNMSGTENLNAFAKLRGTVQKDAVKNALKVVSLPYGDKKPFSAYSLGMKQRLGIANAILNDPELMILDEPTNGLDPIGIAEVRGFLRKLCDEEKKTILISSHILSEISLLADDIGIIHEGKLLEEISMAQLEEKNKKYIDLQVDSVSKGTQVLEQKAGLKNYAVTEKNKIELYDTKLDTIALTKLLVQENVGVAAIQFKQESLEDYFKKLTGGVGIE